MRLPRECYQMQQTISAHLPQLSQPQLTGLVLWVVYPRVCGGTSAMASFATSHQGLSPRVRGNPNHRWSSRQSERSIPACAGEPSRGYPLGGFVGVYPRVCGGTPHVRRGLSPRVRGNPGLPARYGRAAGSIPACAGEPINRGLAALGLLGLSPRVRGNLRSAGWACDAGGSIPACAGEPSVSGLGLRCWRVYPRVCGGTP